LNQALPAKTISLGSNESPAENAHLSNLCGERHSNIKIIETELMVKCYQQGADFVLQGQSAQLDVAARVLHKLYALSEKGESIQDSNIYQVINNMSQPIEQDFVLERVQAPLKQVVAKNKSQSDYMAAIAKHDVVFGLGFLPGDIGQKIDPYLRPLYDALYELLGFERVTKLIERNAIELAPLAYMRGRTLSDAFVIMDEAQNTTVAQMKMLLTRTGFGSRVVITGDLTQVDLPKGTYSGMKHALTALRDVRGIGFARFTAKDIVRHPLVQRIVDAYERHDR